MKKLVALTGAGISAESGISTFRDAGGLWEKYPVQQVASHDGWLADPVLVNNFYNERRRQLFDVEPNRAHLLLAQLERHFDVAVVTQNVDNLHERAGSTNVVHLHGELMKVTSSRNPDDPACIETLTRDNFEVQPGQLAKDGSLLRPYIVFFQEAVPMIDVAATLASLADIFVIIGTSLNVYPAAGLVHYVRSGVPIYLIDPKDVDAHMADVTFIRKTASEGMAELTRLLTGETV
jgi:NAD-dependent deacetylase